MERTIKLTITDSNNIKAITINCPEGKKVVYNEETNAIDFVDIEPIRSKSWTEFCKNHPSVRDEFIIESHRMLKLTHGSDFDRDRNDYPFTLTSEEDAQGILALIQLTRLHDEWVGDNKRNTYNTIYYDYISNKFCISNNYHLLWFPTNKMAKEFLDCFRDLIEKAKRFI